MSCLASLTLIINTQLLSIDEFTCEDWDQLRQELIILSMPLRKMKDTDQLSNQSITRKQTFKRMVNIVNIQFETGIVNIQIGIPG